MSSKGQPQGKADRRVETDAPRSGNSGAYPNIPGCQRSSSVSGCDQKAVEAAHAKKPNRPSRVGPVRHSCASGPGQSRSSLRNPDHRSCAARRLAGAKIRHRQLNRRNCHSVALSTSLRSRRGGPGREFSRGLKASLTKLIAVVRLAAVALGIVAIVATLADTASRKTINPFNFFGFFTMQSDIIGSS